MPSGRLLVADRWVCLDRLLNRASSATGPPVTSADMLARLPRTRQAVSHDEHQMNSHMRSQRALCVINRPQHPGFWVDAIGSGRRCVRTFEHGG